jgi:hypothetical protein
VVTLLHISVRALNEGSTSSEWQKLVIVEFMQRFVFNLLKSDNVEGGKVILIFLRIYNIIQPYSSKTLEYGHCIIIMGLFLCYSYI